MSKPQQELHRERQRIEQIREEKNIQQQGQRTVLQQNEQVSGVQHTILTPVSSARLQRELQNGPPPELGKTEARQWKSRKEILLRQAQVREAIMDRTESQLYHMQRDGRQTIEGYADVLRINDANAECNVDEIVKNPQVFTEHPEILELKNILTELREMRPHALSQEQAIQMVQRYQALGSSAAAGQANVPASRNLLETAHLSDRRACYVLLYHCAATMLSYRLNQLSAQEVDEEAFHKLHALAAASGVIAAQMRLSSEYQEQIAEYHEREQRAFAEQEQLRREQNELTEAKREYLRTGVTENGVPAEWILGQYADEVEEILKNLITDPQIKMEYIIRQVGMLETRLSENRNLLRERMQAYMQEKDLLLLQSQKNAALEQMEKNNIRYMFGNIEEDTIESMLAQVMQDMAPQLEVMRQRKTYLEGLAGVKELPALLQLPGIAVMLLMENTEEAFRQWADALSEQISYNLAQAESIVEEMISPFQRKAVMEHLLVHRNVMFWQSSPAEIRDAVQHDLQEEVLFEVLPEVMEKEAAFRSAMDAVGLDPIWKKAVFRQFAPEAENAEELQEKLQELKVVIEENIWISDILLEAQQHNNRQWARILQWRQENAALEQKQFDRGMALLQQSEEFAQAGSLSLREYQEGGKKAEALQQAESYQNLLKGEALCEWEGFSGFLQGYEADVMKELAKLLETNAFHMPLLEQVSRIEDLETLSYAEFAQLRGQLRRNLSAVLVEWHNLQGALANEIRHNLLLEMLKGTLTAENFLERANAEKQRLENTEKGKRLRFRVLLSTEAQEAGTVQYQHLDDTSSTAINKHSRADARQKRFENARAVWDVIERYGLITQVTQISKEIGTGSGSGKALHEALKKLLQEHENSEVKALAKQLPDVDEYINEFRLGGMEEFLLAEGKAYQDFTGEEHSVYKNTLRDIGEWVMPRMQELEATLGACLVDSETEHAFRLKMRPLLAGLQEVKQKGTRETNKEAEQKNYERFGVKSWEQALQEMRRYIEESRQAEEQELFSEELEQVQQAAELLEKRKNILAEYKGGILRPILPLLLKEEKTWTTLLTGDQFAFTAHVNALLKQVETPMTVLHLRFSLGEDFKRQLVQSMGHDILHGAEKTQEEWISRFQAYFDAFCRHSVGGASIDDRMKKLQQKDPELASYFTEILVTHRKGISLLADEERLEKVLATCKKHIRRNTRTLNAMLERRKDEWSSGDVVGIRMFLQSKILFTHSEEFEQKLPAWIKEFRNRQRGTEAIFSQAEETLNARAAVLVDIEDHKNAGIQADQADREQMQKLREQMHTIGSPLLAAWGVKKAPTEKQKQRAKMKLLAYQEMPQEVQDLLFERILSGADEETVQAEAGWLHNVYTYIRTSNSVRSLQSDALNELMMYLYVHHRGKALSEEQIAAAFQTLAERHVLMGQLLEEKLEVTEERRNVKEAMAIGMYTMQGDAFADLVSRQAEYLKASEQADEIFNVLLEEHIQNADERMLLKIGLKEYFHAELFKGRTNMDWTALEQQTKKMLLDETYRQYLKNSDSLLGSVSNTSLKEEEHTQHTVMNREGLEAFLSEKRNAEYRKAYNQLNVEQRQLFALCVLQKDAEEEALPSMRYIQSDELEKARQAGIVGQIHSYVSLQDFQPQIPYNEVLAILKGKNGRMNADAFEKAMERTEAYIRKHQDNMPKDWKRLADGAASIQEAVRLAKEGEPAHGREVPAPVTTLEELKQRILELDDGNEQAAVWKEKIQQCSDYKLRLVALALEDRTQLDVTTRMKQNEQEVANPEQRETLKIRILGSTEDAERVILNSRSLSRAMTSLLSYQLRDDVDLSGRHLQKTDFAEGALLRETTADWTLLERALAFAEEVLQEEKERSEALKDLLEEERQAELARQAEAERQAELERMAEEERVAELEREERRKILRERRIPYLCSLPLFSEIDRKRLETERIVKKAVEELTEEDAFIEEVHNKWQTNLLQNLERSEALLKERPAFLGMNWEEVRSALLFKWGASFLSRSFRADELDMRIRNSCNPPAVSLYSPIEAVRERLKKRDQEKWDAQKKQLTSEEDRERLQRSEEVLTLLQEQKDSATPEEQWMIEYCANGILEYTQDLLASFPNMSAQELVGEVKKAAVNVPANREIVQDAVNRVVVNYKDEWRPLILERYVADKGMKMLVEYDTEEEFLEGGKPSFLDVDCYVHLSEERMKELEKDEILNLIPNVMQFPEIQMLGFAEWDAYKAELEALKKQVKQNLETMQKVFFQTDPEELNMQDQRRVEDAILNKHGRLLLWRRYTVSAMKELIQAEMQSEMA